MRVSFNWILNRAAYGSGLHDPSRDRSGFAFEQLTIESFDLLKQRFGPLDLSEQRGGAFAQRQLDHLGQRGILGLVSRCGTDQSSRAKMTMRTGSGSTGIGE